MNLRDEATKDSKKLPEMFEQTELFDDDSARSSVLPVNDDLNKSGSQQVRYQDNLLQNLQTKHNSYVYWQTIEMNIHLWMLIRPIRKGQALNIDYCIKLYIHFKITSAFKTRDKVEFFKRDKRSVCVPNLN